MTGDTHVYELDVDGLMAELSEVLAARGYEVLEQIPVGVWWFRTDHDVNETRAQIAGAFSELAPRRLREIEQER